MSTKPIAAGALGELFLDTDDATVMLDAGTVVAWSQGATDLFGIARADALAPGAAPLAEHLDTLLDLPADGVAVRLPLAPYGVMEVRHRMVGAHDLFLLRDVGAEVRRSEGLRAMSRLSQGLLAGDAPGVAGVLQTVAGAAKTMSGAAYSTLMLLRPGSTTEISHFVYDAPRHLFPQRMPRFVGLLAVPITTRQSVRLADIAGHPGGVGLPGPHPTIGPLCAVPLIAAGEVLGLLAIARAAGAREFDPVDEDLMVDLAAHATVAYRWAQGVEREEARMRTRAEVLSAARHDIRSPLAAGKGYAAMLGKAADRMTPEQFQQALEGLNSSFDRVDHMAQQLLADEQLEVVGVAPVWSTVDLTELLDDVRCDYQVMTGRADAVVIEFAADAPLTLSADLLMVREILDNLIGNALKHGGDGTVTVTVRPEGAMARLDVRDTGAGIAETNHAALFERWTRTAETRASGTHGFGLGLSIVKRMVTAHGGAVGVSSRLGEGATFWVTFPVPVAQPEGSA